MFDRIIRILLFELFELFTSTLNHLYILSQHRAALIPSYIPLDRQPNERERILLPNTSSYIVVVATTSSTTSSSPLEYYW